MSDIRINTFGGNLFRGMSFEAIEKEYNKKKAIFREKYNKHNETDKNSQEKEIKKN